MSFSIISFYAIGIIGLVSALVVASSLNPVHRIAFLILVFLSGSFLMIILDFYFLGLTYIIVYVGAIMILFLFVIMMVQIHLMPVSTAIAPRILSANAPIESMGLNTSNTGHNMISYSSDLAFIEGSTTTFSLSSTYNDNNHLNLNRSTNRGISRLFNFYILLVPLFSLFVFTLINPAFWNNLGDLTIGSHYTGYNGGNMIVNYFFPSWFIEFKTMTDLETLANILYLGYPTALLLVGVALWAVLIGIIKVTASKA